jgi:superfamily II DNA or RNA helicase
MPVNPANTTAQLPSYGLLNERLLNDAGGWQVMKQARALHEMGRVSKATWEAPLLEGRVREGETESRSGLRILSKTNVENLCGCRQSRQHGAICAHSVAVGLEILKPRSPLPVPVKPDAVAAKPATAPEQKGPRFSTEQGTPLQVNVVLPPNFASAWEKGQITVGLEATVAGKKTMLQALDAKGEFQVDAGDLRLVEVVRKIADGQLPGLVGLSRGPMLRLLAALGGHPRVTFGKSTAVRVLAEPLRPALNLERTPAGGLKLKAVLPNEDARILRHAQEQAFLLNGTTLQPVSPGLPAAYGDLLENEVTVPSDSASGFLKRELPALRAYFEFEAPEMEGAGEEAGDAGAPEVVEEEPRFRLELEGSLNHLEARLQANSVDDALTGGREALERLQRSGFTGPDSRGALTLKGEGRILAFFARDLPRWRGEAEVIIGPRFEHVTAGIERVQPRLEVRSSGETWFDLHVELGTGSGEHFSAAEIQRLIQSGQSYVRMRSGKTAVFDPRMLEELQNTLRDCDGTQRQPGLYRMDARQSAFLQAIAQEQGMPLKAPRSWRNQLENLQGGGELAPVPLGSLEETLRPYQKQGVAWMSHLARSGLAGILADEMGLGKTLQALAFLRSMGGKALIICPSTLVYNWQREAQRFTPDRKVLAIEGPGREKLFGKPLAEADIVVTSYALLRRDAEQYLAVDFTVTILDEAQHIKNPETQNAQAAFAIQSRHRFVLTGTPVENSVRDIWSLMNFLMPGYLGSKEDFRDRYEKPIALATDGPEQKRLGKRLRPFILRRRKRDVITELPEKIEQVAYCELNDEQRAVYTELLSATRRQISEYSGEKDQNKARIVMLTALLRLRQACNDLRLLKLQKPEEGEAGAPGGKKGGKGTKAAAAMTAPKTPSGKLELFGELLQEMLDDGHRVLVFSQFVEQLRLLEEWLKRENVNYCYLDGSTKDRAAAVDRFQTGEVPVFLISLKAGGVGLNLTAADTVVHFDPWWNPAVEAQATDRAHRIGQRKVVTSYKLITRGTIEEKILSLQAKKRQVIDATVESEEPLMQGLTMTELQELLE